MINNSANFTISPNGSVSGYQWQVNSGSGFSNTINGSLYSGVTSPTLIVLNPTSSMNNYTYRCIVTSLSSQSLTSNSATLSIISPTLSVNSGVICNGNSFTLTPSGASTYTYSSVSNIVTPTLTTSYTVTGTDAAGCADLVGVVSTITVNSTPTITVNSGVICTGQSFTMTPAGANTYT